jgi:hypothetical protein
MLAQSEVKESQPAGAEQALTKSVCGPIAIPRLAGEDTATTAAQPPMTSVTSRFKRSTAYVLASLLCCCLNLSCASPELHIPSQDLAKDDLSLYRKTNNQAGHEFVKTEEFLVPVGAVIVIKGLEFAPGVSTLTRPQERIVQQVFNSLEEITENTVGDTNKQYAGGGVQANDFCDSWLPG